MPWLFAVTLFLSATLLFLVQPMVGKMVLPYLGGSPAVWNTCMVFFQALLLAGYIYAHATSDRLGVRRQIPVHLAVLCLPLLTLAGSAIFFGSPVAVLKALTPQGSEFPIFGVLATLFVAIGIPFFVVSTSAPLLQKWFTETGHPSAKDPYFLYGASNAGSLLSLLAYPVLLEPYLRLGEQAWVWALGYFGLAGLIGYCGLQVLKTPLPKSTKANASDPVDRRIAELAAQRANAEIETITPWQRLHWLGLSFVPSSLMLGLTMYVTTDIASIPLLWILPLALYLITFIIAFSKLPEFVHDAVVLVAPVLMLLLVFLLISGTKPSFTIIITLHMLTFFGVALVMHGELARHRPSAAKLTEFYLWVSLGGVLGGIFNALLAPILFTQVGVLEYPIALVLGCFLLPALTRPLNPHRALILDLTLPIAVLLISVIMTALWSYRTDIEWLDYTQDRYRDLLWWLASKIQGFRGVTDVDDIYNMRNSLGLVISFGLPTLLCYLFVERPIRFGLSVAFLVFVAQVFDDRADVLLADRSYFGVLRVEKTKFKGGEYHKLVHGTTLHGKQRWGAHPKVGPASLVGMLSAGSELELFGPMLAGWEHVDDPAYVPLTYYHRRGPVGRVFAEFSGPKRKTNIALIGLGTGTMAAYGESKDQNLTFFEIDPAVIRLAKNPEYFTFLEKCRANYTFEVGDARLKLEQQTDKKYGVIVVDAFSSDSIPVHLLTREALELYFNRLEPGGVVMLHISNRYLKLKRVVSGLVHDPTLQKNLGLPAEPIPARVWDDGADENFGKTASTWVVLARELKDIAGVISFPLETEEVNGQSITRSVWRPLKKLPDAPVWTDDFSNVLDVYLSKTDG